MKRESSPRLPKPTSSLKTTLIPIPELPWSADLAYVLGLMVTNGNLAPSGNRLEFSSTYFDQTCYIKGFFGVRASIVEKAGKGEREKPEYVVQWTDARLYAVLHAIGFTPHKSLTLGPLKIPDTYFFDFLRGCQDGEGTFQSYFDPAWKTNYFCYMVFTSLSLEYIHWLQQSIERLTGVKGVVTRTGKAIRLSNVKYAKREAIVVLSHLQLSSTAQGAKSKRLKINRALATVGLTLTTD